MCKWYIREWCVCMLQLALVSIIIIIICGCCWSPRASYECQQLSMSQWPFTSPCFYSEQQVTLTRVYFKQWINKWMEERKKKHFWNVRVRLLLLPLLVLIFTAFPEPEPCSVLTGFWNTDTNQLFVLAVLLDVYWVGITWIFNEFLGLPCIARSICLTVSFHTLMWIYNKVKWGQRISVLQVSYDKLPLSLSPHQKR